ncbi:MAG: T9SS type A sorting domain-containing protein [Ignavibacteriae bacterium]|nr:T9SS C-terminal target domain-containing protein [Ignavibacteriota bacterium]NOG98343.1 T9SS type A sorting domain-containing protein [Ignavibacteriota bacterium]
MKRKTLFALIWILIPFLFNSVSAQSAYLWNGSAGDHDWFNPANWTPGGVPGSSDAVTFGSGTVDLSNSVTIDELNFQGGVIKGVGITVTSLFVWSSGELAENGFAVLDSNAVLSIVGNVKLHGDFYCYGTVNWGSGNINLWGGAIFYNEGTFNEQLTGDQVITAVTGSNQHFYNNGTFNKQTLVTVEFTAGTTKQVKFYNNGTATVKQGILKLSSAGEDTGSYVVDADGILEFFPNQRDRIINGPVSGSGTVRFGGTYFQGRGITINNEYNLSGKTEFLGNDIIFDTASNVLNIGTLETIMNAVKVEFNSGQSIFIDSLYFSAGLTGNHAGIAGSDTIKITKVLEWNGGIMSNGGVTVIADSALVTVTDRVKISRPFLNYGLFNWEEGMLQYGSNIINYGHILDRITTDRTISQGSGPFTNYGIYSKLGTGITTITSSFINKPLSILEGNQPLIIEGTFTNSGFISPGSSISNGKLTIQSSHPVDLQSNGAIRMQISGNIAGTDFPQLELKSSVEIGGSMYIALLNNFEPAIGDTFRVMTYYSYTGQFDAISSTGGYTFDIDYHPDHLLLRVESITGIVPEVTESLPEEFEIYQNYPNPFNPSTVIQYSLPETEFVTLKVYDIRGSEVTTLINMQQQAGRYSVQFDAGRLNLASGIYLYSISAGKYKKVLKMMLVQ